MNFSKSLWIITFLLVLILGQPYLLLGQDVNDCTILRRELHKLEKTNRAEILPDKIVLGTEKWLSKYEEWEICTNYDLDIELADKAIHLKKVIKQMKENDFCKSCEAFLKKDLSKYTSNQVIESLTNCGCGLDTPLLIETKSEVAINGSIQDCNKFISEYPNHDLSIKVKKELYNKIEDQRYLKAISGTIQDCNHYLSKYSSGNYSSEIKMRLDRLNTINENSNPNTWAQGDRICTSNTSSSQIQAVIEQWNDNKTKLKVKILAGYEGMYNGEDIFKGNLIWISPEGWYKCIGDENLNYDIPTYSSGGIVDRSKYKYTVGDQIKCRQWASGKSGYNGTVLDKKDSKYLIKVSEVIVSGLFTTNLSPTSCSGHLRLMYTKERLDDEGKGSVFWVDKDCVE